MKEAELLEVTLRVIAKAPGYRSQKELQAIAKNALLNLANKRRRRTINRK